MICDFRGTKDANPSTDFIDFITLLKGWQPLNLNLLNHLHIFQQKLKVRKRNPVLVILIVILLIGFFFFQRQKQLVRDDTPFNRNATTVIYTKHARCRMDCRHIDETEVKEILQKGNINYAKSEPNDKPDPKYALEGITHDGQEVRIVFAPSKKGMVVITVIDLKQEWQCACN